MDQRDVNPVSPIDASLFPMHDTFKMDPVKSEVLSLDASTIPWQTLEPINWRDSSDMDYRSSESSLCSVFGDSDLADAVMRSLNDDGKLLPSKLSPPAHIKTASEACPRRPGTFLNKDGRWIKGKPCYRPSCDKRAQSNGLCKGHGGGARCRVDGCTKSSQGGGLCRAHGGGKRCRFDGCEKGTQRNGFCYLHGGVRSCSVTGCTKKDRGNGRCYNHGGGRRCQSRDCDEIIRRGAYCETHRPNKSRK